MEMRTPHGFIRGRWLDKHEDCQDLHADTKEKRDEELDSCKLVPCQCNSALQTKEDRGAGRVHSERRWLADCVVPKQDRVHLVHQDARTGTDKDETREMTHVQTLRDLGLSENLQ